MTLLLHNLELPPGEQVVTVSVDAAAVSGAALTATLVPGAQAAVHHAHATGAGWIVRLDVAVPAASIQRETAITVRPARCGDDGPAGAAGGRDAACPPSISVATASFGGAVRYDVAGLGRH
jgi:hypothetical protein